jgi:DNA modification methylase
MKTPYYEAPHFKLYLDDCLKILAKIPEDSVDMIYEISV